MSRVSVIGCGDIGGRVARACIAHGEEVTGWVGSEAGLVRLQGQGLPAVRVDLDGEQPTIPDLAGHRLFYFVPPPPRGREDSRVAHLLQQLDGQAAPARVLYLSTTGVYGNCHGEWVDETRPPAPEADRAWRRFDAEQRWRRWCDARGVELVILRVAGIYGPGKLPVRRLQSGEPMVGEGESPITNRIHSLDLVQICLAAMERGRSGEVYNVSDGHPDTMTSYFNRVAEFLGLPRPPAITLAEARQQLSPGMLSYLGESRRLSNRKMLEQLEISLRYPTLEEGLPACLDGPD